MSLLFSTSRRRKVLFAAAAIAAGGYASYRIYNSSAFAHRRKRLLQILSTLSFCCESVSQSAESISILSSDLKSFLLSDDDSVPQSLKQVFKIGQSEEFQGTVTVLSAALIRGLLRGVKGKPPLKERPSHVHARGPDQPIKPHFQSLRQVKDANLANEDVSCREIREVCFTAKRQEQPRHEYDKEYNSLSNGPDFQQWEIKNYSSGSDLQPLRTRNAGIVLDKSSRGKPSEDIVDKLFSKLFSEPGVCFAAAVTGTLARNLVLAFFDAAQAQSFSSKNSGTTSSTNGEDGASEVLEHESIGYEKVIDVICTTSCRMLIAECIQTFMKTAVTVYVDKTKDVNFYNDMVAGITNPSHRDPMKDVLTSVCNGAVETLVTTAYGVMVKENEGIDGSMQSHQRATQEWSPFSIGQEQRPRTIGKEICGMSSEGVVNVEQLDALAFSKDGVSIGNLEGSNSRGVQSFINGFSKVLAIPSNRKLFVDVAGTVTSEAVRSFVDALLHTASNHISSKMGGSWAKIKGYVRDQQGLRLQEQSRNMAVKAFVLASVCLAICLHMLSGLQILQKA